MGKRLFRSSNMVARCNLAEGSTAFAAASDMLRESLAHASTEDIGAPTRLAVASAKIRSAAFRTTIDHPSFRIEESLLT
jgi:hypothetical protein